MARKKVPDMRMQIVGQEIVTRNIKVSRGVIEAKRRIKLKLQGVDGDKATRSVFEIDPKLRDRYPFGAVMHIAMIVEQAEFDFDAPVDDTEDADDDEPEPTRPRAHAAN